jgi:hypothetical protein
MRRSLAMRTFVLGVIVIAMSSCAAYEPPYASTPRREVLFQASHEKVFDAVLNTIDDEDLYVNRVDHHLGVVTTRAVSLSRNVPREIEEMCLPFGVEAGSFDAASYSLRIIVRSEGSDSSTVEVTPRFRLLLSDTPYLWRDCPVEGPLEREFVQMIQVNVNLDQRLRID